MTKHSHYHKDVRHLDSVDIYAVCELFGVDDPSGATQHAIKKLLMGGKRGGGKDLVRDLKEARDTIERRIAMLQAERSQMPPCGVCGAVYGGPCGFGSKTCNNGFDENRADIISLNGNDGLHYDRVLSGASGE